MVARGMDAHNPRMLQHAWNVANQIDKAEMGRAVASMAAQKKTSVACTEDNGPRNAQEQQ